MKRIFDFFTKKFIKNYDNINSKETREAYGWLAGTVGVIINTTILLIELFIGIFLNSVAVKADAAHNLTDAVSSVISVFSIKLSNRPADDDHPFGHGRIEYITALLFSTAIFIIGYEFIKNSISRIKNPVEIAFSLPLFLMMLLALPLQIFLNRFTNYIGNKINSSTLKAAAVESYTDILVLSMVILSMIITRFTTIPIDGYVGIIVSLFILHSGYELLKDTLSALLGKAPDRKLTKEIAKMALSYPNILGVHDMVVHNYGPGKYMASLHTEVPYNIPLIKIHDIIDRAEKEIGEALNIFVVIHIDPVNYDSPEVMDLKRDVASILKGIEGVLSFHDFRVVGDGEEKNLLFDIVVDKHHNNKEAKNNILQQITYEVHKLSSAYSCNITFDTDFI